MSSYLNEWEEIYMKSNRAFTLAEVLITLGIVGIIAALTTPVIIHQIADSQIPPKLFKFETTFENAVRMLLADEDSETILGIDAIERTDGNSPDRSRVFGNLLSKYMKISDTTDSWYDVYNLDGSKGTRDNRSRQYSTEDGMYFRFIVSRAQDVKEDLPDIPTNQYIGLLQLDIDGPKGQNALSKDLFWFGIYNDGTLRAIGSDIANRSAEADDLSWRDGGADESGVHDPQTGAGSICDNGRVCYNRPVSPLPLK